VRACCRFGRSIGERWVSDSRCRGVGRPVVRFLRVAAAVCGAQVAGAVVAALGSGYDVVGDEWVSRSRRLAADPAVGRDGEDGGACLAVSPG